MDLYPYAHGALLDNPQTYFYTPYQGAEFLRAWRNARSAVQSSAGAPGVPPAGTIHALPAQWLQRIAVEAEIETQLLLESTYGALRSSRRDEYDQLDILLARLVKKFEVSKRWYDYYGPQFRPLYKDGPRAYRNLGLYVRAAEVFEVAYTHRIILSFLNVFIKSLDTLCALVDQLNQDQRARLSWLIDREKFHVSVLAQAVNVSL